MQSIKAEQIAVGPMRVRFLIEAKESGGALTMFEFGVPGGVKLPAPHSHDAFEETIYGLEGVLSWTVGGQATELGSGDALTIPRGVVHSFDNPSGANARMLAVATPGVFGPSYFRDVGEVLAKDGPPDVATLAAVMRSHGLTPAPPAAG